MRDLFFQVAIGFVPAIIAFALIIFLGKKHRVANICMGAVCLVVSITAAILGFVAPSSATAANNGETDTLTLIYALTDKGDTEVAQKMLDELYLNGYSPEYTLCSARLAAQKEDAYLAKALYQKVSAQTGDKYNSETNAVNSYAEAQLNYYNGSLLENASETGTIYMEAKTKAVKTVRAEISDMMEDEDELYSEFASYIAFSEEAYNSVLSGNETDSKKIKSKLNNLNEMLLENPAFNKISAIRLARLKMQIVLGSYSAVARSMDFDANHDELMVVSELYLNKKIKGKDFDPEVVNKTVENYKAVYDQLEKVANEVYSEKSKDEREQAKKDLATIRNIIKRPEMGIISSKLSEYVEQPYAPDASKVYLQLAKIEHSLGNDKRRDTYLDRSIDTVGDCVDANYTQPMYQLISIISDKEDGERLKDVAGYVDDILDNNMTAVNFGQLPASSDKNNEGSSGSDTKPETQPEASDFAGDFAGQMQTYVSQKRMSVKIVAVNTENFEKDGTVVATVNISNNLYTDAQALKEALKIKDCDLNIEDFTVEKVEYSGSNILFCVDVSGSMSDSGKIEYLKSALRDVIESKPEIESIALVTFESGIRVDLPFGTSTEELLSTVDSLRASGGTAIYSSLRKSITKFKFDPSQINTIIVMSDGQDGDYCNSGDIEENIKKPAQERGVTVYSIGFGADVEGDHLSRLASCTGGTFLYAEEPDEQTEVNQLTAFFEGLRAQVLNQYKITFKAKDTLTYARSLKVTVGEGRDSDTVKYYLGGDDNSLVEPEITEDSPLLFNQKTVTGFDPHLIYKNGKTQTVRLTGSGFKETDGFSVALKGADTGIEWELETKYVDESSIECTIPAGIGVDIYDVHISINGKNAVLNKGLAVFVQGSEKVVDFGEYRFSAYTKTENKSQQEITLSGYVTMNGWLSFNGDIKIKGDLKGESITITDLDGSRINYSSQQNLNGLAKIIANTNRPVNLEPIGTIALHNDKGNGVNPTVELVQMEFVDVGSLMMFGKVYVTLHPARIEAEFKTFTADFPFVSKIIKNQEIWNFELSESISFGPSSVDCMIDFESQPNDAATKNYKQTSFGNLPIMLAPGDFHILIDTYKNDYEIDFNVNLEVIDGSLGLSVKWNNPDDNDKLDKHSNGLVPTEIKLKADVDINSTLAGVPVTWSDFSLGLADIDTSKSPFYWTLEGGFTLSACKLSAYKPLSGMKDYIGDVSILSFSDATVSLNMGKGYIGAKSDFKLFGELDMGKVSVDLGNFPYDCELLNMKAESVTGLSAKITAGPDWKLSKDSKLKLQLTGTVAATDRFIGIGGKAEFEFSLKLWLIKINSGKHDGEIVVGIRRTASGDTAFVIRSAPYNINLTWPENMAGKISTGGGGGRSF